MPIAGTAIDLLLRISKNSGSTLQVRNAAKIGDAVVDATRPLDEVYDLLASFAGFRGYDPLP